MSECFACEVTEVARSGTALNTRKESADEESESADGESEQDLLSESDVEKDLLHAIRTA